MLKKRSNLPELVNGMADCIFAFGQLLANAGLLDRRDLAAAFSTAVAQGARQQAQIGGDTAARTTVARALAEAFAMPLVGDRSGLRIIDGGRPGDDHA